MTLHGARPRIYSHYKHIAIQAGHCADCATAHKLAERKQF